ncbi:MAG: DoxX family protein [Anaerolineae bacterium]
MAIATWTLAVLLGFFFPVTGMAKILGQPKKLFKEQKKLYFDKYGIDRKGIRSIGFAELMAGLSVWFWVPYPMVARTGAVALVLITAGAIFFHYVYDEEPAAQPAILMCILSIAFLVSSVY